MGYATVATPKPVYFLTVVNFLLDNSSMGHSEKLFIFLPNDKIFTTL